MNLLLDISPLDNSTTALASPTETVSIIATATAIIPRLQGQTCAASDAICESGTLCVKGLCVISLCTPETDFGLVNSSSQFPYSDLPDPFRFKVGFSEDDNISLSQCCQWCQQDPDFCTFYNYLNDETSSSCTVYNVESFSLDDYGQRSWQNKCLIPPYTLPLRFQNGTSTQQRIFGTAGCGYVRSTY